MASPPSLTPKVLSKVKRKAHRFLHTHFSSKNREISTSTLRCPPPSNSLPGLPAEIKQIILSLLPDATSLHVLISTCSSLYYSFLDSESSILAQILPNQITPSLMPNALATFKSSEMTPWTKETADDLARLYTSGATPSLLLKLTLRDALAITKMHECVRFFANRFTTFAISHHPVTGVLETPTLMSPSELDRIQRTLYRFEFMSNLSNFRRKCSGSGSEILTTNFLKFAPWENEQLACISDFLIDINSRALIDYGIERIAHPARFSNVWPTSKPENYGLAFLHRLVLAKTHKERNRLLSTPTKSLGYVVPFEDSSRYGISTFLPLSAMDGEEQRRWISPPVVDDGDSGPEDAWRWAYSDAFPTRWYNTRERDDLRKWGYVMWDSDRLDEWGILKTEWTSSEGRWYNHGSRMRR